MGKHTTERAIDQYKASIDRYNNINKLYPNMIENKICMMLSIIIIYNHNTSETDNFLTIEGDEKNLLIKSFLPDGTELDEARLIKN